MKTCVGVVVHFFVFLTLALVGSEWPVSRSGLVTPEESPRYPLDRRLGEPQIQSGRSRKKKNLITTETRTTTPRPSSP
jgi:hypothetical protein